MTDFLRKRNRLPKNAYTGRGWYFVTICTGQRRAYLNRRGVVDRALEALMQACARLEFEVHAYCFMPDHLHLELVARSETSSLPAFVRFLKGKSAAELRKAGVQGLWQKGYYDHVLRAGENENAVAWYIFNNPVRKGLVAEPREWPFAGSWTFDWKRAVAPTEEFVPPWRRGVTPRGGGINPPLRP